MNKKYFIIILLGVFYSYDALAIDYKVAVRAHRGTDAAIKQWQATVDLLSKKSDGNNFKLIPIISLIEITQRSGQDEFDFLLTNPSSYVEIEQLHGATILATLNNKRANTAQNKFGSVIFTHARNEDIITLKDLKNKTLMAVSEEAFGGWRVAWLEMLKKGFDPYLNLKKLIFTKSKAQYEVVFSVRDGLVDVGVVRTDLLERMEAAGIIDMRYFRIINNKDIQGFPFFLSSDLYPEWAFSALKHVSVKDVENVRSVLLSITDDSSAAIMGKYIGWIPPQDYKDVKALMKKLKVGPYAK